MRTHDDSCVHDFFCIRFIFSVHDLHVSSDVCFWVDRIYVGRHCSDLLGGARICVWKFDGDTDAPKVLCFYADCLDFL